jgi:hypothetical protein
MEARIARIESALEHIAVDIKDIRRTARGMLEDIKVANDRIGALRKDVAAIETAVVRIAAPVDGLKAQLKATEARIIRWFVCTTVAMSAAVFVIARYF